MIRKTLLAVLILGGLSLGLMVAPAAACPMCKTANENAGSKEENLRPKAYMYSILLMLAMPATLATGFGIGFYRLAKRRALENADCDVPDRLASRDAEDDLAG